MHPDPELLDSEPRMLSQRRDGQRNVIPIFLSELRRRECPATIEELVDCRYVRLQAPLDITLAVNVEDREDKRRDGLAVRSRLRVDEFLLVLAVLAIEDPYAVERLEDR